MSRKQQGGGAERPSGNGVARDVQGARDARDAQDIQDTQDAADAAGEADPQQAGAADHATEPSIEDSLADELERARAESAGHYDRLLRAQAELQNVLKRHEKERLDRSRYAAEPLARDLLPIVDDLERALRHVDEESHALAAGVELVYRALVAALAKHGVERVETKGKAFDPAEHEAVAVVETADAGENTVVEEHRAGYRIGDRLLRPAMVAVARAPQGDGAEPT